MSATYKETRARAMAIGPMGAHELSASMMSSSCKIMILLQTTTQDRRPKIVTSAFPPCTCLCLFTIPFDFEVHNILVG